MKNTERHCVGFIAILLLVARINSFPIHSEFATQDDERRPSSNRRRDLLLSLGIGSTLILPLPSQAESSDAGEAVRRAAANLPGYGPPDVFFPKSLLGSWTLSRTTTEAAGGQTETISYLVRFVLSADESSVVMDRGFNQQQFLLAKNSDGDAIQSCEWKASNPNDLRWTSSQGARNEVKVTRRATDYEQFVSSSEFQRVTREQGNLGIPVIEARRVLTKYQLVDQNVLEGIELVYSMGASGGDPMTFTGTAVSSPKLVFKSKLRFERR